MTRDQRGGQRGRGQYEARPRRKPQTIRAEGSCQSGKVRFASEGSAARALLSCWSSGSPRRAERRWYPCDRCRGFHLTSWDQR